MKIRKIGTSAQSVSRWSGGTTTQLAIYPPEAAYADRDFLWRISSAVVELPESDFTLLPDYDRILMILEGELALSHDGGEEYTLHALDQTAFDGGAHTYSRGQVTDFNLMMRKGHCTGSLSALQINNEEKDCGTLMRRYTTNLFYCVHGEAAVKLDGGMIGLNQGEALLIEAFGAEAECVLQGKATIVLAGMQTQ